MYVNGNKDTHKNDCKMHIIHLILATHHLQSQLGLLTEKQTEQIVF